MDITSLHLISYLYGILSVFTLTSLSLLFAWLWSWLHKRIRLNYVHNTAHDERKTVDLPSTKVKATKPASTPSLKPDSTLL